MSDQEERAAQALADWIDAGGKGPPPEGVDPDIIGAAFVLNNELVPEFNPSFDSIRSRILSQREATPPPVSANNNRWFRSGSIGALVGAAAVLLISPTMTVSDTDKTVETQAEQLDRIAKVSERINDQTPFKPVVDKSTPFRKLNVKDTVDARKVTTPIDGLDDLQLGTPFVSTGWSLDDSVAKRAVVVTGRAAVQAVQLDGDTLVGNQLTFVFLRADAVRDPLAPGQAIAEQPQAAAKTLMDVLESSYAMAGYTPDAGNTDSEQRFCREDAGRVVRTEQPSDSAVTVTVAVLAEDCPR